MQKWKIFFSFAMISRYLLQVRVYKEVNVYPGGILNGYNAQFRGNEW